MSLVTQICDAFPEGRVHLAGHSMGGALLWRLLKKLHRAILSKLGRISFIAADCQLKKFDRSYAEKVGKAAVSYYCRRLENLLAKIVAILILFYLFSDKALLCSRVNVLSSAPDSGHRRLGHRPSKCPLISSVRVPKWMAKSKDPTFIHSYVCLPELLQDIVVRMARPEWPPQFRGLKVEKRHFRLISFDEQKNAELKKEPSFELIDKHKIEKHE